MTAPDVGAPRGLVLCGLYGTGKSSVAEEIAVRFEHDGTPFAAIDMDWLSWFGVDDVDPHTDRTVFMANLSAMVANYLGVGVRRFVMAGALADQERADALRAALPFPTRIVELRAPWDVIERRLRSSPTSGRLEDLEAAREHSERGGGPTPDAVVDADRPLPEVADEVLRVIGWATA
jgi:hypothetical protein